MTIPVNIYILNKYDLYTHFLDNIFKWAQDNFLAYS